MLEEEDDQHGAPFFVQTWAEAVLRQLERVIAQRKKSQIDLRNNEHDDWSTPDEVLYRNFRAQWVEEHTLVWAGYQLERWTRRLAIDRGEPVPEADPVLATVRNALEHLDEADFEGFRAMPGPLGRNTSLRSLPGETLEIVLGKRGLFLDSIELEEIEKRARAVVNRIDAEADAKAEDMYAQEMIDKFFGK